jgi:hypothetical protein
VRVSRGLEVAKDWQGRAPAELATRQRGMLHSPVRGGCRAGRMQGVAETEAFWHVQARMLWRAQSSWQARPRSAEAPRVFMRVCI